MVSRGIWDKYNVARVIFQTCPKISRAASASDIWDNFEILQEVFIPNSP